MPPKPAPKPDEAKPAGEAGEAPNPPEQPKPEATKEGQLETTTQQPEGKSVKETSHGGGCCTFIYNKRTGEVLGRTGLSWLRIFIFYVIFFLALAAFFALMLYVFFLTLSTKAPKYSDEHSFVGTNPGVGFRPKPDQETNVDSSLIWFDKNKPEHSSFWSDQLEEIIALATSRDIEKEAKDCTNGKNKKTDACRIDVSQMGKCTKENKFGYEAGEPCVLVKLNRIFGWKPKGYKVGKKFNKTAYDEHIIKSDLPKELKHYIKLQMKDKVLKEQEELANTVWITCDGENPYDRANMGQIIYNPMPGIPKKYFPFKKQKGYQSPFIMVQFSRATPGVLINIECKAWADNIEKNKQLRSGLIHFEILVN